MKRTDDTTTYAAMGMAALVPGMQFMLERMQAQLNEFRATLLAAQGRKPLGRPPGAASKQEGHAGWPADPEARKVEMRRRMAVAAQKNGTAKRGLHPRDAEHPDHAKWAAKMRRAQKKAWAAMSEADKKERIAKATAGRTNLKLKAVA